MEWMKSFSTFSRITFDNGLRCAEGEPATLPDLRGKGSRKRLPTRSLDRNENSRDKSQKAVFCGRIFHRVFRCVFRRTFRHTFSRTFRCTFRHIFRQARPCNLSSQGISIHVTTKRLCQMRWHNIDNTEKHAIMEEGADMPETHCLSHPLCLTTLMEHTCDTHCAPSHQI